MSLERESIDITTLPCKPCEGAGSKYASFRTTAPGYAAAEGSMTVLFSKDANSASNRLLANSMLDDQAGATAKFYIDAVCGDDGVDDSLSNYIEAPITLNGFEITVNTEDAVEATINFGFAGQPTALCLVSHLELISLGKPASYPVAGGAGSSVSPRPPKLVR